MLHQHLQTLTGFLSLISCSISLARVFSFSLNCPISSIKSSSRSAAYFFCRLAAPVRRCGWGWMGSRSKIQMSAEYLRISIVERYLLCTRRFLTDHLSCVTTPEFWCNPGVMLLLLSCGCHLALNLQ